MTTWVNTEKSATGVAEVDFVFSDSADFLFSDGSDYVFSEGSSSTTWVNTSKNSTTWTNTNKS